MSVLPKLIRVLSCFLALVVESPCKTSRWVLLLTWRASVREGGGNTVLTLVTPSLGNDASGSCQGSASHLPSGLWSKLPLPLFSLKAAILTFAPWPMERRMCSHWPGGSPHGIPTNHAVTAPVVLRLLVPPLGAELCRSLPSSALRFLNVIFHLFSFFSCKIECLI